MPALDRRALENAAWFPAQAYPFTSHFADIGGHRLHYLDEGTANCDAPLVLVHGTPSWSFEFRQIVSALSATNRCLVLDHLGFGLSDRPQNADYSVSAHAARFEAWLTGLGLSPCSLLVHDFGGPIALPYALKHPDRVSKLVLGNTWFWPFEQVDPGFAKQKPLLSSTVMRFLYLRMNFSAKVLVKSAWGKHAPLGAKAHACYHRMFPNRASRLGTWGFAQSMVNARDYYASQRPPSHLQALPALVVWGVADRLVPPQHLAHWRAVLPGAQVLECPDVGHFVFDEAADLVMPRLRAFLAEP